MQNLFGGEGGLGRCANMRMVQFKGAWVLVIYLNDQSIQYKGRGFLQNKKQNRELYMTVKNKNES